MSNSLLLPCPFCGSLPENDKGAYVHCANAECPVCVEAYGTEAIASWNTRSVNGLPEAIAALELARNRIDFLAGLLESRHSTSNERHFFPVIDAALTKLKG